MFMYTALSQDRLNRTWSVPAVRRAIFSALGKQRPQLRAVTEQGIAGHVVFQGSDCDEDSYQHN